MPKTGASGKYLTERCLGGELWDLPRQPERSEISRIGTAGAPTGYQASWNQHDPGKSRSGPCTGAVPGLKKYNERMTEAFFRAEGRAVHDMRPVRLTPGYVQVAEGSALIEVGHTRVLCNATIEQGVPAWLRNSGRGWVTAEYGMLPRATLTRTPREAERGRVGGRTHEIQRLIGRSLRAVVDMKALGERTVVLDCDVLQADGGTRTAAITGACTALAIAFDRMVATGALKASPLRQLVAATSVGIVEGAVLLDLSYEEDSQAEVDMNLVMTEEGGLVEVQATAERASFARQRLLEMMDYAEAGIRLLHAQQRGAIAASAESAVRTDAAEGHGLASV